MFKNGGVKIAEYVYDFAVDGGTQKAYALAAKANKASLPLGCLVKSVTAKVVTQVLGAGLTMKYGNTTLDTGYSGPVIAVATLVDNYVANGAEVVATPAGHLFTLFNNVVPHAQSKAPYPVLVAADADFVVTIGGGNATAGKVVFLVEYMMPSSI